METVATWRELEYFWLYRKLSSRPVGCNKNIFRCTGSRPISEVIYGGKSALRTCHFLPLDDIFEIFHATHQTDGDSKLHPKPKIS